MEVFPQQEVDVELMALEAEDVSGPNMEAGDEVESLRNSLRDAIHDVNVRPKMQCLMMDSSFSMVTVQGEDSGIAWETTPSSCSTPWPSETPAVTDLRQTTSPTPATHPAGKIIFVMDEDVVSRRRKPKEKPRQEVLGQNWSDGPGRPELVEFSQPNVKEREEEEEKRAEPNDGLEEKEKRLFSLVSEGSEILNIVVPPKIVTVDEEESGVMVDNLSYLEDKQVLKANTESQDEETLTPPTSGAVLPPPGMDPPGAPVAKPPVGGGATGHMDYFQAFSLMDAEAPGGPAAAIGPLHKEQVVPEIEERRDTEKLQQSEDIATTTMTGDAEKSDSISLLEITDEVFYGNMDSDIAKSLHGRVGGAENTPIKVPAKASGSNLFGSQEDILTPIFLPEGPPKIIDPILLEEPKAMAFLYTDLYEEALGSRTIDEDAASVTSEKSFHSRQSDREARGYLEKYVLIDETPVVEVDTWTTEEPPIDAPRTLTQDLYEFGDFLAPETVEIQSPEEEFTDFFRSSGNSSPCGVEPFLRSAEDDDDVPVTKSNQKEVKRVSIKVSAVESFSVSDHQFSSEEPDVEDSSLMLDYDDLHVATEQDLWRNNSEISVPVPPPRRKVASSPKSSLDLTPLTPVDAIAQDEGGASGKEQREEEKETADEGCGDEGRRDLMDGLTAENWLDDLPVGESEEDAIREEEEEEEEDGTQTSAEQTEVQEPPEKPEKHEEDPSGEEAKPKAQCVIL